MNSPYASLIPTKVGIQVEQVCVALLTLYALDTVSWHGMSGLWG